MGSPRAGKKTAHKNPGPSGPHGPDGLTPKRRKLVKLLTATPEMRLSDAARASGLSPQGVQQALATEAVQNALGPFYKALEDAGATDTKAARVISDAMDAARIGKAMAEDGTLTIAAVPDHKTRLKGAELYSKVKRYMAPEKDDDGEPTRPVQIVMNGGTIAL